MKRDSSPAHKRNVAQYGRAKALSGLVRRKLSGESRLLQHAPVAGRPAIGFPPPRISLSHLLRSFGFRQSRRRMNANTESTAWQKSIPQRRQPSKSPLWLLLAVCLAFGTGCEEDGFLPSNIELSDLFSPIEVWRINHFGQLESTGPAANSADPDADGRPNLVEYALGTNPTNAISHADPVVTVADDRLVLTFDRIADGSLVYTVEGTDSLTPPVWTAVWTSTGSDNTAGPVAVQDVVRISTRPTRFLRLAVSH
jgi:hypothetical protein